MQDSKSASRAALSRWFVVLGVGLMLGSAALAARLVWEQTALSWNRGPQMIGFSLAHGTGALLFLFPLLLTVWLVMASLYLGVRFWKTRRITVPSLQAVCSAIALLVILSLPQGFWIRLFVGRFAESPRAADFLIMASSMGEMNTVQALVKNGVPVNQADYEGKTPLHGAARGGNAAIVAFLISRGADVNALSSYGDSPLEDALSRGCKEAAAALYAHGAKRVKGTSEQRTAASRAIVREQMKADEQHRAQSQPR